MEVLSETNFKNLGELKRGKVRDVYVQPDKLLLVSTDRHSSFDRIIAHIPAKGQILTETSLFWFEQTKDIIQNHVLGNPDPNVVVAKKCEVIPVEVVIRGYITGVTDTSLWKNYEKGQRDFGDFKLPDGLVKNAKLDEAVITPTTKFEEHDRNLTRNDIFKEGLAKEELWKQVEEVARKLFARGQEMAKKVGYILVDTKYEFGIDTEGKLTLIDEIHTPDSSRYWKISTYEDRLKQGLEPENFDKEFLRLWFKENCDPYKDKILPEAPRELVEELSRRYKNIYEELTGKKFIAHDEPLLARIEKNLLSYTV